MPLRNYTKTPSMTLMYTRSERSGCVREPVFCPGALTNFPTGASAVRPTQRAWLRPASFSPISQVIRCAATGERHEGSMSGRVVVSSGVQDAGNIGYGDPCGAIGDDQRRQISRLARYRSLAHGSPPSLPSEKRRVPGAGISRRQKAYADDQGARVRKVSLERHLFVHAP